MRKSILILAAVALSFTACNSTEPEEQAKLDSIAESAVADSMLNAALENDTLKIDSASTDTVNQAQ